jgi:bacterioferritin
VAPNASQLRPAKLGQNLQELLLYNLSFENELVQMYAQATQHCARIGDQDSRVFFETLLNEEKAHAQELTQWLKRIEQPVVNETGVNEKSVHAR